REHWAATPAKTRRASSSDEIPGGAPRLDIGSRIQIEPASASTPVRACADLRRSARARERGRQRANPCVEPSSGGDSPSAGGKAKGRISAVLSLALLSLIALHV